MNDIDEKSNDEQMTQMSNWSKWRGNKYEDIKINVPVYVWYEYRDSWALDAAASPPLVARYNSHVVHLMAYRSSG